MHLTRLFFLFFFLKFTNQCHEVSFFSLFILYKMVFFSTQRGKPIFLFIVSNKPIHVHLSGYYTFETLKQQKPPFKSPVFP